LAVHMYRPAITHFASAGEGSSSGSLSLERRGIIWVKELC